MPLLIKPLFARASDLPIPHTDRKHKAPNGMPYDEILEHCRNWGWEFREVDASNKVWEDAVWHYNRPPAGAFPPMPAIPTANMIQTQERHALFKAWEKEAVKLGLIERKGTWEKLKDKLKGK